MASGPLRRRKPDRFQQVGRVRPIRIDRLRVAFAARRRHAADRARGQRDASQSARGQDAWIRREQARYRNQEMSQQFQARRKTSEIRPEAGQADKPTSRPDHRVFVDETVRRVAAVRADLRGGGEIGGDSDSCRPASLVDWRRPAIERFRRVAAVTETASPAARADRSSPPRPSDRRTGAERSCCGAGAARCRHRRRRRRDHRRRPGRPARTGCPAARAPRWFHRCRSAMHSGSGCRAPGTAARRRGWSRHW